METLKTTMYGLGCTLGAFVALLAQFGMIWMVPKSDIIAAIVVCALAPFPINWAVYWLIWL